MKKELKELQDLIVKYANGDDTIGTVSSLPPVGQELTVESIVGRDFRDRATQQDVDNGLARQVGDELPGDEHLHKFIAVNFTPSGTLSGLTLLRSPEITWDSSLNTKSARLNALQDVKLTFVCREVAKSKSNRTYNIYHMSPISIGSAPAEAAPAEATLKSKKS